MFNYIDAELQNTVSENKEDKFTFEISVAVTASQGKKKILPC